MKQLKTGPQVMRYLSFMLTAEKRYEEMAVAEVRTE